ncbi:hypothetical protein [Paenirhodobacter sp.]|jgi:hypothetical protein
MSNRIAFGLALLLLLLLCVDGLVNDWAATIFLSIRLLDLIAAVAFWR